MLKSILYDYNETHILVKGSIANTGARGNATARAADRKNKQVIFKTCDYISRNSYSINIFMKLLVKLVFYQHGQ